MNERARERAELMDLYAQVRALYAATESPERSRPSRILGAISERVDRALAAHPAELRAAFYHCCFELISDEELLFPIPDVDWDTTALLAREEVELRALLRAQEYFLTNEERCSSDVIETISSAMVILAAELSPLTDSGERALFNVALVQLLRNSGDLIHALLATFCQPELVERGLFKRLCDAFIANVHTASNVPLGGASKKPLTWPDKSTLPPSELAAAYLAGTPILGLLEIPVPLHLSHEAFFSHMHVCGGSGAGKTQWLSTLILHHLTDPAAPALVIVDSQTDFITKLSRLEALKDRAILITPKEINNPPAINVFDLNRDRIGHYDNVTREQVVAGAIQTFDYLFSGLVGADLTAKQSVFFRFVCRLLLTLPDTMGRNATILDMVALMEDEGPYREAIEQLPAIQRKFFEKDFRETTFKQTKEQIRYRLNSILENPTMERLFTAPSTRINIFDELNKGSVILVDTAKDFLKSSSPHFGRLFISLVLQAIMERAAIEESMRKPAFLIADEAAEYFDQNIDDLLMQTRKYKLGCVFAHQYLDQCTSSLRASLAANTSIKMASRVSTSDARALAPDLRTTPDFILGQPKLQFACYVRDVTSHAISVAVEAGRLEREQRMSEEVYAAFRERNRQQVSIPREPPTTPVSTAAPSAAEADPFSSDLV